VRLVRRICHAVMPSPHAANNSPHAAMALLAT